MARPPLTVVVVAAGIAFAALAAEPAKKPAKAPAKKPAVTRKAPRGDGGTGALELGTLELKIKGTVTAYLDGRELGQTPLKPVKVLAGAHKLRLVNAELGIDQTMDVDLEPNQRQTLEISFE